MLSGNRSIVAFSPRLKKVMRFSAKEKTPARRLIA